MTEHLYATVAQLKARLLSPETTDTSKDTLYEGVLESASRAVDDFCARVFWEGAPGEIRYFSPLDRGICYLDDAVAVTAVATDETLDRTYSNAWATTDWELQPFNAAARSRPYLWMVPTPNGANMFPPYRGAVKVTGTFGWAAVPAGVMEATLILAMRLARRGSAIWGTTENVMGGITKIDARDAEMVGLLTNYIKHT
jgi:hypothetical protein